LFTTARINFISPSFQSTSHSFLTVQPVVPVIIVIL
jgi:hypothetical protein